ncbi:hypothetical protein [Rhizobium vallis]|uniref:hypothetical protein n=1 Tax=Rhizobium vallis TaxID=634290 RepID=UPI00268C950A
MFLEDEFAIGRMRMRRVSVSFLVAVTAFVACIAAMLGFASAARAETQPAFTELAALVRPNDVDSGSLLFPSEAPGFHVEAPRLKETTAAAPTAKAATMIAQKTQTVNLPQTATRADEQIMRGLTILLMALTAASGLAVWRRRLKGLIGAGAK